MANNFSSNTVEMLARTFLEKFESSRCVTKAIDTQLIQGEFTPRSGGQVSVKRPHDYNAIRTVGGDISGSTKSDIISGKATATVQDYITIATEWSNIQEALEADQIDQILAPMATRAVTTLETSLSSYMLRNANLSVGTPGTAVTKWSDVAAAGALMDSIGVPMDNDVFYVMNPYTTTSLADTQSGLASGDNDLVNTAWRRAQISRNFGGMAALSCNTLQAVADDATLADRAGTLSANPVVTYVAAKDTMKQTLSVSGFSANANIVAGSVVEITGRHYLNQSTRTTFTDGAGNLVKYRAVVTETVTLSGTGTGDIVVAGPAIFEATGQYNTVDSAPVSGDVITVLGAAGGTYQPNLFFHRQAYGMATVKLPKLYDTDTVVTTEDGFSIRVSKYSDGDANQQKIRFDLLPAFVTFNPF
ncbi:MAG: P22 phage major capsid protein family protein, partial [Wenzhouxiangella sp.]|nr:P22 phage major capsid protein family protein [Wenzhouxiangella sp.]